MVTSKHLRLRLQPLQEPLRARFSASEMRAFRERGMFGLPRYQLPIAWVVLLASAGAVASVGIVATAILLRKLSDYPQPTGSGFWWSLLGASALTVVSLGLRSLRWTFLLRRARVRIPIRDALIGYFSGFSLLFAPFLAGEIAVRALINGRRARVPVHTTIVVNFLERLLDATALSLLALFGGLALGHVSGWVYALAFTSGLSILPPVRRTVLRFLCSTAELLARPFDATPAATGVRLADLSTWSITLATSLIAWLMPGMGLWGLSRHASQGIGLAHAIHSYAASSLTGPLPLAPGGVLVLGPEILKVLVEQGTAPPTALLAVLGLRLSTVGVSVALGVLFALFHFGSKATDSATHFDDIANAYDAQILESRRQALLIRKTEMMKAVLDAGCSRKRGLDVGCGQGAYVGRMRELGFDVEGIDTSEGQVRFAVHKLGNEVVRVGSVLDIPFADATFDFLFTVNVLHHLSSVVEQRRAFAELFRVLKPGGLLLVHEINTRNILFRFYMGYVFPMLNCIDEGTEQWLLAHKFENYTSAPVVEVRYFTFLPDFLPALLVKIGEPLERYLERSAAKVFSAHYMVVLQK